MTEVFQQYGADMAISVTTKNGVVSKVTTWEVGVDNSTRTVEF